MPGAESPRHFEAPVIAHRGMIRDFDRFKERDERLRGGNARVRPGVLIAMAGLVVLVVVGFLFIMLRFARA